MKFDKGRDFEHARGVLEQWLCHRLDLAGATVTDLVLPDRAGLSNETILFTAELTAETDGGTTTTTEELVVRISPAPENQLCRDTLFEEQARLLQVLHDQGVRVPECPVVRGRPEVVRPSVLRDGPRARAGPDQRADLQRRGLVARRHACATAHRVGRSGRRARPHQPDATRPRALPPRGDVRVPRGARRDPRRVRVGVRRGCAPDRRPVVGVARGERPSRATHGTVLG